MWNISMFPLCRFSNTNFLNVILVGWMVSFGCLFISFPLSNQPNQTEPNQYWLARQIICSTKISIAFGPIWLFNDKLHIIFFFNYQNKICFLQWFPFHYSSGYFYLNNHLFHSNLTKTWISQHNCSILYSFPFICQFQYDLFVTIRLFGSLLFLTWIR